jgi:hypothetical protein
VRELEHGAHNPTSAFKPLPGDFVFSSRCAGFAAGHVHAQHRARIGDAGPVQPDFGVAAGALGFGVIAEQATAQTSELREKCATTGA